MNRALRLRAASIRVGEDLAATSDNDGSLTSSKTAQNYLSTLDTHYNKRQYDNNSTISYQEGRYGLI